MSLPSSNRSWLRDLFGGDQLPVDGETSAWALSFVLHIGALVLIASLSLIIELPEQLVLTSTPPDLEEEVLPEQFEFSHELQEQIGALGDDGSLTAEAAAPLEADFSEVVQPMEPVSMIADFQAFEIEEPLLMSPIVDDNLLRKGVGSVGASGASGAVDRITQEILLSIDQRPTLVVWLFDQSGSLQPQREEIVQRFDRIYAELGVVEAAGNEAFSRPEDKPLLTAVAQFGSAPKLLTEEATDNLADIKAAVRAVSDEDRNTDREGEENVFRAVGTMVETFKDYRLRKPRRNVMVVVFTDEAGDDIQNLDAVVKLCRKFVTPVYVVGVPAPFGREKGYVKYVHPDPNLDQTPQRVAVDQGPESLMPERIKLGFLGGGPQDEVLDSGFGPYGLARLTYETGGMYFTVHPNRRTDRRIRRGEIDAMSTYVSMFFNPRVMRRYRPDYTSVDEYRKQVSRNRAMASLVEAAAFSQTTPMERVQTRFEKRDEAQLAESLSRAQREAAKLEPKLIRLTTTLLAGENDRKKIENLRWQAGYDLALGRSLAAKVRTEGYNAMLAKAKQGMKFEDERNDTWIIQPSTEISTGSVLSKQAEKAESYLTRVVTDHPGTPWAMLAQQELDSPFGWEWRESFSNIAGRMARAQNNANRPRRERPPQNLPPRKPNPAPPRL